MFTANELVLFYFSLVFMFVSSTTPQMEVDSTLLKNKTRFSKLSRKGRLNLIKENSPQSKILCKQEVIQPSLASIGNSENDHFILDNFTKLYSSISTLPNLGSTCFCNAMIQVLRFTPGFLLCLHQITDTKSFWKKGEVPYVLRQLHKLFQELKNGDFNKQVLEETNPKIAEIIKKILNSFSEEHPSYHFGQQYDAHEFLGWILRLANCDINEVMFDKNTNKRILSFGNNFTNFKEQFLEGKLRIYLICLECEEGKWKEEKFWDLPFTLCKLEPKDDQSEKSKNQFSWDKITCKESILNGDHKYWCEKCLHHVEAKHNTIITDVPKVVIFHLTQLYNNNNNNDEQNNCEKNMESELLIPETLPCIRLECEKPCAKHLYKLYGVIVHIGSTQNSGHYVVLLKLSFQLRKVNTSLLSYQKEVRVRPVTRLKTETDKLELKIEDCCLFAFDQDKNEEWILCDDENTELFENCSVNIILEKLGTSAKPNVLFYCLCDKS